MFLKFNSCKGFMSILWCQWPQAIIWAITDQANLGYLNTLRPRQDGRRFADDVCKCIFLNENIWISLEISLKFVLKFPINNIPALVQILAWHRSGDKPLSEPMMVSFLTHICVTRPQWEIPYTYITITWASWQLKSTATRLCSTAFFQQWTGSALVQTMACHLLNTKPLPEPMLTCCQ